MHIRGEGIDHNGGTEISTTKIRACEIGVGERCTAQVCPDQSGATEIGTLEVGAPQIRPLKISIP